LNEYQESQENIMSTLSLRAVKKSFDQTTVLQGIDLEVRDGEFVVFVGPSGCGKSTLLRCIAGLEDPSAGELLIDGQRINEVPPAERGLAMVFQSYALYPHMTVAENMSFGLRLAKTPKAEIERAVAEAAEVLRITPLLQRYPAQLSGGQRQRVAIGRAIVRRPGIFLFDEPLSNLDAALRTEMRVEMARLHAQLGATIIYVTHDQAEAMTLADRIVVFNAGRIEQAGPPLELYRHPANLFVAGFLGSPRINLLAGTVLNAAEQTLQVDLGADGVHVLRLDARRLQRGERVTLGLRPESMMPGGDAGVDSGHGVLQLSGTVQLLEHLGDVAYLHVLTVGGTRLCARAAQDTALREGSSIILSFGAGDALVFDSEGRALAVKV
jgi:multiple sugar transport system ATP-binding protein